MTTRPYAVAPPARSLRVDMVMALLDRMSRLPLVTPHLHGGEDVDKITYEIDTAWYFWSMIRHVVSIDVLDGKDVLDIGCGWGGKAIYMAQSTRLRSITGFDLPEVFSPDVPRAYAERRGETRCRFTTGYAEAMPFEPESFDIAIMDDVMEHVHDPASVLSECARVLRRGGTVVAKFPSIRMLGAHHLDRAANLPGLHYLAPLRVWAAGLNYRLAVGKARVPYEPFSRVVATRFHRAVTENLNGLGFRAFEKLARESPLAVRHLELLGHPRLAGRTSPLGTLYRFLRRVPPLREPLSDSVLFVGEKRAT